ncbi:MAG: hypothetical protein QM780_03190 [Hyphomicrobium sp.]|uniref:hypothetical protein n=1 Tax=Hyphomicrobium sp. TaxID=82 RepID=UPI0039E3C108
MSSNLWLRKHAIARGGTLQEKRKREQNDAALIYVLIIGICAALGIVLLANVEPGATLSSVTPAAHSDSAR